MSACSPAEQQHGDGQPTVMVVEDVLLVRHLVAGYLRECGFRVIEAISADEAIRLLETEVTSVDLVFADINMPGTVDGFGLAQWTQQNRSNIKVVLGSGMSGIGEKAAALCHEGPIISKPYDLRKLEHRLRHILDS